MTPIFTIILLVLCFGIAIAGAASPKPLGYVAMGAAALAVVLIALAAIGSIP